MFRCLCNRRIEAAKVAAKLCLEIPKGNERHKAQVILVRRINVVSVQGYKLDFDLVGALVESDLLALIRCLSVVPNQGDIGLVLSGIVGTASVVCHFRHAKLPKHL